MRTLTSAQETILGDPNRVTYYRVFIDGTNVEDWLQSVTWSATTEGTAGTISVTLAMADADGNSVAPIVANTIQLGDTLTVDTTTLDASTDSPTGWQTVADGVVTSIDWTGATVQVGATDRLMAHVQSRWIESERDYGTEDGELLHTTIQAILDDWTDGIGDLYVPTAPGYRIRLYDEKRATVYDAINRLAGLAGWVLRQLWNESDDEFQLALVEPDRASSTADWTISGTGDYISLGRVAADLERVRNAVEVEWVDSGGITHTTVRTNSTSIVSHGRRWMPIEATAQINTETEAEALAGRSSVGPVRAGDRGPDTDAIFLAD